MIEPSRLLGLEMKWFLWALAATFAYRMLTRKISLAGLFGDKATGQAVSPERVQLFMATLAMSAQFLRQAIHGNGTLPDVSPQWLVMFGASSGLYAVVKGSKMWRLNQS